MKNDKACIFNIQKYSIHDGSGIRTVVFFKGCPLKCEWCSNPESQDARVQILWDKSKCLKCGHCINVCEKSCISLINDKINVNNNKCSACLLCTKQCPNKALFYEGEYKSISDIMKEVLKDKDFYEESNGGVTLSGGEVLVQHEIASELLKELKKHNIHTAIETTGYSSPSIFKSFIKDVDLLLFDVKHYNREKHFEKTGVYNDIIIENLKYAINSKKDVIVRIPVIPGFNSSLEDAEGFSKLLKSLNVSKINILPFHQYGQKKYTYLNKNYVFENVKQLHEEDLESFKNIFISNGLNCYF
ncbi:glycyl-radical enzyme activating protein [Clostridium sp. BJN0001]|uniref:glycyl-radical enzyme activating protein n=1 Tax=Clostridium sp. BJN0001 TaxID=2930219 RepID=UPI001FD5E961|nr:glycyl-radical enzyme activating protein [Clostridium sp. BJN0001]